MKLLKKLNNPQSLIYLKVFCVIGILLIMPFSINNHREVIILEKKLNRLNMIVYKDEDVLKKRKKDYDEKEKKQREKIDRMKSEIIK